MPTVNWGKFVELPGDKAKNFELLCRAIIRRHYGQYGDFRALANQPGVEFHLKLGSSCALDEPERWYGWQCRWYDLPSGRAIGTTRRNKIVDAIRKTEEVLPGLTDWVLWTRHPLTERDQVWFYNLPTRMTLHLWTATEVEEHLSGSAEILRSTYFDELILTPDLLKQKHNESVAPIRRRWLPEVHQVVDAERILRRLLGEEGAWSDLAKAAKRLEDGVAAVRTDLSGLPPDLKEYVDRLIESAASIASVLSQTYVALMSGDYEVLRQELNNRGEPDPCWNVLLRRLRNKRYSVVLQATNVVADTYSAHRLLTDLHEALEARLIAVIADAGCGKTQLAAQLTAPTSDRLAGMLLHGSNLASGGSLNDLARRIVVNGRPVQSFEALVAAVDTAGQRAARRLPLIIDGLNEAEDPRDWKGQLASLTVTLDPYPHVLVIFTLRSDFVEDAVPDEVEQLKIPGFEHDTVEAVRRYFSYYRIDPSDAELPWELLEHPLTLRMFCEVTNPKRKQIVGVEAMPSSLTALWDRYLEQVAERIAQLSPRAWRYFEPDVRTALSKIGLCLWESKARSLDFEELRETLRDDNRPWAQSIVRALEQEGVIIRISNHHWGRNNHIAVVHDALSGHLIADALLDKYGGHFECWLREPSTTATLSGDLDERHPLASDIFRALVGLAPRRQYRRQLWPLLDDLLRTRALYETAWLDKEYLGRDTVEQLAVLVAKAPVGPRDLFDRLWTTRAARYHPLDAHFLDEVLRLMSMPERDLRWTEWIRRRQEEVLEDLKHLEHRWRSTQTLNPVDQLRAHWVMWTLTSTVRLLRDQATRVLYWFGCRNPKALFELALNSLGINDPYVPERVLAACYGVVMSLWSDPQGDEVREQLPDFANKLVDEMFVPEAPYPTRHVLMRDYALGVIDLAARVAPGCVPNDKLSYLMPPFDHIPSPFPEPAEIDDTDVAEVKNAIHMDFGNYTISRLIPDRRNYDFNNHTYREVRRQIEYRIVQLGYTSRQFAEIDREISNASWRAESRGAPKTDRYGKKYSWISFFEMYGIRSDEGALPEWRAGNRSSDTDIDPSFPEPARIWQPLLHDIFASSPAAPQAWIKDGPTPDYGHLLYPEEVDGQPGPWVLLNGYIEQSSKDDERQVFTLIRGLLVEHKKVKKLLAKFNEIQYPGNMVIPEPQEDYYTYAGEIPWSPRFGITLREPDGRAKRDVQEAFEIHNGRRWLPGIPVEVPVYSFVWESYHSVLNQVSGIMVPAPALCEQLRLSNRHSQWDLYDPKGCVGTMYREFKADEDTFRSYLLYLRVDLMERYLDHTHQTLVWLLWGERGFKYNSALASREDLQDLWSNYNHIHRHGLRWES